MHFHGSVHTQHKNFRAEMIIYLLSTIINTFMHMHTCDSPKDSLLILHEKCMSLPKNVRI